MIRRINVKRESRRCEKITSDRTQERLIRAKLWKVRSTTKRLGGFFFVEDVEGKKYTW